MSNEPQKVLVCATNLSGLAEMKATHIRVNEYGDLILSTNDKDTALFPRGEWISCMFAEAEAGNGT